MSESVERERLGLRRALTLGVARQPIEVPDWLGVEKDSGSELLSLVAALGLRSRFDRPEPPARLTTIDVSHDPERMLPSSARTILKRLFAAKKTAPASAVALRILDALKDRGLALHPFDYRSLWHLVTIDDRSLDDNARDWLRRQQQDDVVIVLDDMSVDNWTDFPPAMRVDFVRDLRETDPRGARELLADAIVNDTAAVRGKLVEALFVGLGPDDVEFLESLSGDRAASVKKIAKALLARIDGTDEHRERLANAHEFLNVKSGGVIGRRKILEPKIPKGTAKGKIDSWMELTFGDVNPMQVANSLGLLPKQFAESLGNLKLRALFFVGAIDAGESELATLIAADFDVRDAYTLLNSHSAHLGMLSRQQREAIWPCFQKSMEASQVADGVYLLGQLYEVLRTPPPDELLEAPASPRRWKKWLNSGAEDSNVPELLISLSSGAERDAWRGRLEKLPPAITANATALADLFDAIETAST